MSELATAPRAVPAEPGRAEGVAQASGPAFTPAAAEAEIARIEAGHDLLRYQVDGWSVWPLLRLAVAQHLLQVPLSPQVLLSRGERIRLAAGDLAAFARLGRSDYLVKSAISGLADREGGRYRDTWFHDLLCMLPDAVRIERLNAPGYMERRGRAVHPAAMSTALFETAGGLLSRAPAPDRVRAAAAGIAGALGAEFGAERFPARWVLGLVQRFYWERRAYQLLLSRLRPRWVFTATPGEYPLAAAARERGITVLELQHGVVYDHHPAYAWTEYAVPYRDRMPLPDRLLVYGEHWRRELARRGFWGDALHVLGSLRMDAYRARRPPPREGGGRMVLVTSQGIDTARVAGWLAEFLRQEPDRGLRLVVKLHPGYEQRADSYLPALGGDARASIVMGPDESTFDLLLKADLHLSISSTCHYEALGLGVPTAVLPFATHEIVAPLWRAGHATLLSGPGDLRALLAGPLPPVDPEVSAYYFRPGAARAIRTILDTHPRP